MTFALEVVKIEREAVNLSVFINFDDFEAGLNWFPIIRRGTPGNFATWVV